MTVDGEFVIPKVLQLNRLTVGQHVQTVALQDTAGNVAKYTNTFVVTTSFADLAAVIDQYANNGLRTTLNGAQAVGATGLRLATPFGFRAGQTLVRRHGRQPGDGDDRGGSEPAPDARTRRCRLPPRRVRPRSGWRTTRRPRPAGRTRRRSTARSRVQPIVLDTGANQEVISVKSHIVPVPAAPAPNVILNAPLAKDHAAGTATSLVNVILSAPLTKAHASGAAVVNPRPFISAETARGAEGAGRAGGGRGGAGKRKDAAEALHRFKDAVAAGEGRDGGEGREEGREGDEVSRTR